VATGQSIRAASALPQSTHTPPAIARLVAVGAVATVLALSYAPNLSELVRTWTQDPDYSHGFLVIPVALLIGLRRHPSANPTGQPSPHWGWLVLAASLAARAFFYERDFLWSETATLIPVVASLVFTYGGWPLLRRFWPGVAFLAFMLPLPGRLNTLLALPLQHLATRCSCWVLRLTGLWVFAEGNVIVIGDDKLEVAAACNGLSMLMCLLATVAATMALIPLPAWKRIVLLLSAIPIALFSNVVRIAATAWCYHWFGAAVGGKYAHDLAGWLMMPLALLLVGVELLVLSWLVAEEDEADERSRLATSIQPLRVP
jgi:exosortase